MNTADHQRVIAELDVLFGQVTGMMQRFEATGFNMAMKDDYVTLHTLQSRIVEMRLMHSQAIDSPPVEIAVGEERH